MIGLIIDTIVRLIVAFMAFMCAIGLTWFGLKTLETIYWSWK